MTTPDGHHEENTFTHGFLDDCRRAAMTMFLLVAVTLFVGFMCGCTSVGGVLLIPALVLLSGLDLRMVMGTVLLSFFFSGSVGAFMHYRAGRLDFSIAVPLCLGAVVFGFAGAVAKQYVSVPILSGILGVSIIIAGITTLRPLRGGGFMTSMPKRAQNIGLIIIGSAVAFLSAMTGAGGPVLSVPLMIILGYPPLASIVAATPLSVVLTFSGSIGNILVGSIDYRMGVLITALMMLGVAIGTYSIKFFNPDKLKIAVAVMCIVAGVYMLVNSLM